MILTQDQWMAQQPGDTYSDPGRDPNVDYTNYLRQNTNFSDTSSLPHGFLQSEFGGPYQSVLNQFNDPNYDKESDINGLRAWLTNAPLQFNSGRSLADWGKPSVSADYDLTNAGIKTVAGLATGGISNLALAGINATDKGNAPVPYTGGPATIGGGSMPTYGTNMPVFPGSSGSSGLFDNLLGTVGNLSPALLAGYLGNSQRQDVMGQVGRLNDVAGSLSGPAFMQSITNPYDLQTGQGRTALSQSLQQRGVGGSSFGNQQLGNYDYQRGLGRGDLATRAGTAVAGTQGQLYSDALRGIVGGNAAYNSLLGAGLGASGSLFNQGGTNPLAGLIGGAGGVSGMGGSLSNYLSGLFGTGTDNTPIGVDPYGGNPGGQVDFGNAPSLGIPDSTSGNGLFDWLNQNGAGGDLGLNF